jgi:hypothetical protein
LLQFDWWNRPLTAAFGNGKLIIEYEINDFRVKFEPKTVSAISTFAPLD